MGIDTSATRQILKERQEMSDLHTLVLKRVELKQEFDELLQRYTIVEQIISGNPITYSDAEVVAAIKEKTDLESKVFQKNDDIAALEREISLL